MDYQDECGEYEYGEYEYECAMADAEDQRLEIAMDALRGHLGCPPTDAQVAAVKFFDGKGRDFDGMPSSWQSLDAEVREPLSERRPRRSIRRRALPSRSLPRPRRVPDRQAALGPDRGPTRHPRRGAR